MPSRRFKKYFNGILEETPLPYGDKWKLQPLQNSGLRNNQNWYEILYRTTAHYKCNKRHQWKSSWSMILFRCRKNFWTGFGVVRMKRFGMRCSKCPEDKTYHMGVIDEEEIRCTIQLLLLHIVQKYYEGRPDWEMDVHEYIIPAGDVSRGKYGGIPHPKRLCEACTNNRCQEIYRQLTR